VCIGEQEKILTDIALELTRSALTCIGEDARALQTLAFTGKGELPSAYAVTDFASAAMAIAAFSVAELAEHLGGTRRSVIIDRRLASFWLGSSVRPIGWALPPLWDPLAGDYPTSDGWIRLHTNAPHHRAAAQHVLGPHADKASMTRAVAHWRKRDLETAIVEAGGCAAEMRSAQQWADHPQGRAVASEPLARIVVRDRAPSRGFTAPPARPLAGVRVLDLTRVLAGPVASRFLAGYGADVLRIDPPDWNEPGVVPEVTLGKRCARLDLKTAAGRATFEELLSTTDIFLHGYRPDALDGLGYDEPTRRKLAPGLIDVGLSAYGWSGPWSLRRGFDSLVQMSTGIAEAGMRWKSAERPVPLPAQALDHTTGYLMAATAVRGLTRRLVDGYASEGRLSLARTAKLLVDKAASNSSSSLLAETAADVAAAVERTAWGEARRLIPPVAIEGVPMKWVYPAGNLGSAEPRWK
jgi:hypothetical protein